MPYILNTGKRDLGKIISSFLATPQDLKQLEQQPNIVKVEQPEDEKHTHSFQ